MCISFFPESVAGPIVRARTFLWQVQSPKKPKLPRLLEGLERFAIGFFKKAVIADNLTPLTDQVFADPLRFSAVNNAAALVAWGFVIYCDFSGYSDMAIGCARMLGFKFLENFHFPYLARSLPEFWRRWHISLSEWLRDYLYIPLGGNRHGPSRTMIALLLTMLLGGLWHGASWTFVVWGAWWGMWLAAAHLTRGTAIARLLPWWVTGPATFAIAMLGWIPFRCDDLDRTREMASRIFSIDLLKSWSHLEFVRAGELETMRSQFLAAAFAIACVALGHVYGLVSGRWRLERRDRSPAGSHLPIVWYGSRAGSLRGAWIATVFVAALLLRQTGNVSFIYFQF
jgi:alginate O-acetyltransferase complex protein AlgI